MARRSPESFLPLKSNWLHILLSLVDGEQHGYGIMQDVLERSGGQVRLWPGMLYRNLQRLAGAGWIAETPAAGPPVAGSPKYFTLTAAGRRRCAQEAERLAGLVATARARRVLRKT